MPRHTFEKGNKLCVGRIPWNKGKVFTQMLDNQYGKGKVAWNKGKKGVQKHSLETRKKMSESQKRIGNRPPVPTWKGANTPNWKGGVSSANQIIRHSLEYRLWRKSVYERDNYTCVFCGAHGVKFHADHIKSFAEFPELRFAIDNGRTLCVPCHTKTDNYGFNLRYKKNGL